MIATILSALVVGLIVGALGSFIGTWLTYQLGYHNANGGWQVIPFLVGIIVAIILIAIYVGITGRRGAKTPNVRR